MVHINGSLSSSRETGGIQSNPGCSRHLGGDKALQGNKTKYQAVCFRLSLHKSSTQGKKLSLADGKTHHSWSSKISGVYASKALMLGACKRCHLARPWYLESWIGSRFHCVYLTTLHIGPQYLKIFHGIKK